VIAATLDLFRKNPRTCRYHRDLLGLIAVVGLYWHNIYQHTTSACKYLIYQDL